MGTESVVIYYGVKFPVSEEEIEKLRKEKHSSQLAAKECRLDSYWGNCATIGEAYYLFIGKELGLIGGEYRWNKEINDAEIARIIEDTKAKLKKMGVKKKPKLLMHLEPDW